MFRSKSASSGIDIFGPVFDSVEDGVIIVSQYGNIIYANKRMLQLTCLKLENILNKSYLSIRELNWMDKKFKDSSTIKISCRNCKETNVFHVKKKNFGNNDIAYIIRRRPAVKTYKKVLVKRKKQNGFDIGNLDTFKNQISSVAKGIFEGMDIGLVLYSHPDFKVVDVNNKYLELLTDKLLTRDIIGLEYEKYLRDKIEIVDKAWNENVPKKEGFTIREISMETSSGTKYYHYNIQPIKKNGKVIYWLEAIVDVTEHITLKKEAITLANENQEKLNKFRTLVNSMNDGVWVFDTDGKVIDANNSALQMFGYDSLAHSYLCEANDIFRSVDLRDVNGNIIVDNESVTYKSLKGEVLNNQEAFITNFSTREKLYVSFSASPIYNNNGKIDGAVLVVRNINERVLARKQKEALIKMQDEFLAIISHELRTPITVINSALQSILLLHNTDLNPKVETLLGKIKQNSLRLLKLINNLLDITKAQAGFIKPAYSNVDIVELSQNIISLVSLYANNHNINLSFHSDFKEKIIAIDQDKYERILMNLLSNSIKYTPKGKHIFVRVYQHKDNVCISIKDTGIGIPKDKLKKIFDRFVQVNNVLSRHREGTGLGLSIVKTLVESMDGSIEARSEENIGSEFTIYFPDRLVESIEDPNDSLVIISNHLAEKANIEFSDIYLNAK